MSKEVRGIEEALEVLSKMNVAWATVNRIQNSMWDTYRANYGSIWNDDYSSFGNSYPF